jgi:predicted TIM-barrel fold metal-dependent hydrolase
VSPVIDAHVHAFPRRVPDLGPLKMDRAAARISRLAAPFLGIERVAALHRRAGRAARPLEQATSLALLAPVMLAGTVDGLLAAMARAGVGRSLLIGSRGVAGNDWLLDAARRAGDDRLVPVATLPELRPGAGEADYLDAYDDLARRGARGFKIHTNWDDLDAGHPAVAALFAVAARHGRFVILHTGCFHVPGYRRSEACDLRSFERWLQAFPGVRVCLAHMNRERPEEAWAVMRRHEQVFADTSWQPEVAIRRAVAAVGSERLMLGSDWPLLHVDLMADARERAERAASGAALDDLLGAAARRFLGEA